MDMASTAILSSLMRGSSGANIGGTPLTDICGSTDVSFKSVMSGILTGTAPSAEAVMNGSAALTQKADAKDDPMAQLSIGTATGKMLSVGNEAALKYFMGTYLSSKQDFGNGENNVFTALLGESGSGDFSEVWDKLMSVLSASDIADMSAFSAEMETFLFTGETRHGNKDKGLGSSLADVFDDMDLRIMAAKAKKNPEDEVNAILASLAVSTQVVQTDVTALQDFVPEDPVLDKEDRMALTALLENSGDEVIRDLAKELTAVFTSRLSEIANGGSGGEDIVNAFEATLGSIASYGAEKTVLQDVISKLKAAYGESDIVEVIFTEEKPADSTAFERNDSIDPRLEALGNTGQANVRNVNQAKISTAREVYRPDLDERDDTEPEAYGNARLSDTAENGAEELPKAVIPVKADETLTDTAEKTETDTVKKNTVMTENIGAENTAAMKEAPAVRSTDIGKSSENEEMNFKTMEQVITEIRRITAEPAKLKGSKELTIKLRPETLGEITVKITKSSDGNLDITLAAHNRDVSDLLKANSAQLANSLADKGADVRSVNIIEASQADQSVSFGMNGNGGYDQYGNRTQDTNGGRSTGHSDSDEDDDITISAINDADDIIYSREAKLWAKI